MAERKVHAAITVLGHFDVFPQKSMNFGGFSEFRRNRLFSPFSFFRISIMLSYTRQALICSLEGVAGVQNRAQQANKRGKNAWLVLNCETHA